MLTSACKIIPETCINAFNLALLVQNTSTSDEIACAHSIDTVYIELFFSVEETLWSGFTLSIFHNVYVLIGSN